MWVAMEAVVGQLSRQEVLAVVVDGELLEDTEQTLVIQAVQVVEQLHLMGIPLHGFLGIPLVFMELFHERKIRRL
jgi:hypothetical protein